MITEPEREALEALERDYNQTHRATLAHYAAELAKAQRSGVDRRK